MEAKMLKLSANKAAECITSNISIALSLLIILAHFPGMSSQSTILDTINVSSSTNIPQISETTSTNPTTAKGNQTDNSISDRVVDITHYEGDEPGSYFDFEITRKKESDDSGPTVQLDLDFKSPRTTSYLNLSSHNKSNLKFLTKYQLMYSDIYNYNADIFCKHKNVFFNQPSDVYRDHCVAELFTFNHQGLVEEGDITPIYCGLRTHEHSVNSTEDIPLNYLIISQLLPSQLYEFNVTLTFEDKTYGRVQKFDCQPPGKPQFPPQTDSSSFSVIESPVHGHTELNPDQEIVNIYWRTLPKLLQGAEDVKYEISCTENKTKSNFTLKALHKFMGRAQIEKSIDSASSCRIRAKNRFGYSKEFSQILVPARRQLLDLGRHFRFSAYAVTNQKYLLEWNPLRTNETTGAIEALPRNTPVQAAPQGYFVIYWCLMQHSVGCQDLSGMVKISTSMTNYTLELPKYSKVERRLFGFSYTQEKRPHSSTGIIWAKCDTSYEQEFALKALRISLASGIAESHTSVVIQWMFPTCETGISRIKTYEINYCRAGASSSGCGIIWTGQPVQNADISGMPNENCTTIVRPNRFIDQEIIDSLIPSTRYSIRMRYTLTNGTTNAWSNTLSVYTAADPSVMRYCWRQIITWTAFLMIFLSVISSVAYMRWRTWWTHSRSIFSNYKKSKANITHAMSGFSRKDSEVSLSYCVNRASSERTLSMVDSEDGILIRPRRANGQVEHQQSFIDQNFEYIPRKLLEGNQNDGTAESCSDSAQGVTKFDISSDEQEGDDLSLSSQSSFLRTLLDDQTDLNNNSYNNNHNNNNDISSRNNSNYNNYNNGDQHEDNDVNHTNQSPSSRLASTSDPMTTSAQLEGKP